MMTSKPVSMLCIHRPQHDSEAELERLLRMHHATRSAAGLVTDVPAAIYRGRDKKGVVTSIETFEWKDAQAPETAHRTPAVLAVWEPMGAHAESMEFLQIERLRTDRRRHRIS